MYTGDRRMGYRPGADATGSQVRDKAYPSEIAAQRPALTTRIHCTEYNDDVPENSLRGGDSTESRWDELRAGMRDKAHGNR